jgi:hypothetical protein
VSSAPPPGDASAQGPSRAYAVVSATFQNREYPEGTLRVNEAGSELELSQWTGRKKKRTEAVIAKFRLEPNVEVLVDGPLLRVSDLSVTLESPAAAGEVAELLRRPSKELEVVRLVSEAETSVGRFLESREEALSTLSRIKADPRNALFAAGSTLTLASDVEPLDALYSTYSARLAESLEQMKASLAGGETILGSGATERLYAIAYTVGAVQNALFDGDSDLAQELAALQELGIATTAQELRMENPTARLMARAQPALVALATSRARSG